MCWLTAILVAASASIPVRALAAQALEPGSRLRIRQCSSAPGVDSCRRLAGSFVAARGDSVIVRDRSGLETALAWNETTEVRVFRGRRRHVIVGALVGTAVGAAIGVAAALAQGDVCGAGCEIMPAAGAGIGLVLGSVAGSAIRSDRWVVAKRGTGLSGITLVGVALAQSGRPGVALRFAF